MANSIEKTSSDLQREIDADRQRIGDRIDAIQERMSPGQLVDEVLAYAKGSGGGEYVRNLGQALKDNPAAGRFDGRQPGLAHGKAANSVFVCRRIRR